MCSIHCRILVVLSLLGGCAQQPWIPSASTVRLYSPVAIVTTGSQPVYAETAAAVIEQLGRPYYKYSLERTSGPIILELMANLGIIDVIAIGEQAALATLEQADLNVVYCQVFDSRALQARGYRGVSVIPAFAVQLEQWRLQQPGLQTVGVITSGAGAGVMDDLLTAARALDIKVLHEQVASDQAALYAFRRMVPDIDGFALLPDAEVLSPQVIREILDYGVKHEISVLGYNQQLLALGASLVVATEPRHVASQVLALLGEPATVKLSSDGLPMIVQMAAR